MDTNEKSANSANKMGISRLIFFLILVISIICISFLAYVNSIGLDLENMDIKSVFAKMVTVRKPEKGVMWDKEYSPENEKVLGISKGLLILHKDGSIFGTSDGINKEVITQAPLNNPISSFSGNKFAVADKLGYDIFVLDGKNIVWKERLNNKIINISINSSGYLAVIHDARGYNSAVSVYDPKGTWIFTQTYSDRHALHAQISENNNRVLINCMDATGINAYSYIELRNILGTLIAGFDIRDKLFPYAELIDDNIVLANGKGVYFYDNGGKEVSEKSFIEVYSVKNLSDKYLTCAVIDPHKTNTTKAYNTYIEVFDSNGREYSSINLKEEVYNLRSFEDIIAVNTGRQAAFFDEECNEIYRFSSMTDIWDIYFFNRAEALIVSRNKITAVRFLE